MVTITGFPLNNAPIRYNSVLGVEFSGESTTEPVTIAEVKAWMRIDFPDDDAFLSSLITMCREITERYTCLSLITRTVKARLNNGVGNIELPYGPVNTFTNLKQEDGTVLNASDYVIDGVNFQTLETIYTDEVKAEYTAGYTPTTIPPGLKMGLMRFIAFSNEHRGDTAERMVSDFIAQKYRRTTWLL